MIGLLALDALVLGAGFAVLAGMGLARPRHLGLAFVVGWAALGILASLAAMAGASLEVWQVLLLLAVAAAAGLALARRVRPCAAPAPRAEARWPALAFGGLAGAVALLVLARAAVQGTTQAWDGWAFWIPKALAIVEFGGLDSSPGGFASFAHPDYPPLVPVAHAISLRFGGSDPTLLPLQDWALFAAFLGAVAGLLARRVPALVLWPAVAMLALLPQLGELVGSSLADPALAELFALAGIAAALWLRERDAAFAALAALLLAAAALAKNEGVFLALVLAVALAVASRRVVVPALLAAAGVLAVVPWRIWLAAEDIPLQPDYRVGDLADPGYLADRIDRLGIALADLPGYLLAPDRWLLAVPLALAAAILAARRRPPLALFAGLVLVATFAALLAVYWISPLPIDWYIETSGARAVASTAVFAAALLPLLLGEALDDERLPAR